MIDKWDIFNALTCDSPMLADITDDMLPPFNDRECKRIKKLNEATKQSEVVCFK